MSELFGGQKATGAYTRENCCWTCFWHADHTQPGENIKQPNTTKKSKSTSAAVILRYFKCAMTCLIVNISTNTAHMMDMNLFFLCDKRHYEACLHLQQSVNPQHAADE